MFAVLAEDKSDADSLVEIIKKLLDDPSATVRQKGFSGCGELCRKASSYILHFAEQGATRFIICHDSDGNPPDEIRAKVRKALSGKAGKLKHCLIVVPVQEIEAWLIADEEAIKKVIPSMKLKSQGKPEGIASPKEWLINQSRKGRSRPLYDPPTYNVKIAKELNTEKVSKKCPSFSELADFVSNPK
jgi:Domain of unknown function (DUF4276)